MPVVPFEYDTVVGNGDVMTVDGVMVVAFDFGGPGFQVDDELMAKQIEVDPLVGAAAFFAAEDVAIECSCFLQIIDRNGDVEGCDFFHYFQR